MSEYFSRPVRMTPGRMEGSASMDPADTVSDPAERSAIAHATAHMLVFGGGVTDDSERVARLVAFADENGLDTVAELWAGAHPVSLPGALWRLYLVRAALQHNIEDAREVFSRGITRGGIDQVVAGAPDPVSADALSAVLDDILRGAFEGDFSLALERASAVARAVSAGAISLSQVDDDHARYLTGRSLSWSIIAQELFQSAKAAGAGALR